MLFFEENIRRRFTSISDILMGISPNLKEITIGEILDFVEKEYGNSGQFLLIFRRCPYASSTFNFHDYPRHVSLKQIFGNNTENLLNKFDLLSIDQILSDCYKATMIGREELLGRMIKRMPIKEPWEFGVKYTEIMGDFGLITIRYYPERAACYVPVFKERWSV